MFDLDIALAVVKGATVQVVAAVAAFFVLGYIVYRALTMSLDRIIDVRYQLLRLLCWSPVVLVIAYLSVRLTGRPPPEPICRVSSGVPYLDCADPSLRESPVAVLFVCITAAVVSVHYGRLQADLFVVARECSLAILGFATVIGVCYGVIWALQTPELFH